MATIGIDIGTSYSSVCILDGNGQPERVKVATGTSIFGDSYSLPSAVFIEADGRLLLGQSAMASRMRLPENFKSEFKRDLGQPAPYLLGDRQFLPEDLYKEFFIYLKKCVEDYTQGSMTEATITCPAVFNRSKKELIQSAAKKAGLLNNTMLDEPSAAAYCYLNAGKLREGDTLLVYDLGGGTFDVALLRYTDGAFAQLTQPLGIACCGGADFDKLIYDHIMEQIGEERLAPVRANPAFFRKFATQIMETSIKAKHHLSSADVFSDVIPVGYDAVDFLLTRNAYNAMIAPIVDETLHQVRTVLKNAGTQAKEVKTILLVGGASRTPLVREMLARVMGKEPLKDIDPELAVCAGAAVYGKAQREAEEARKELEQRFKIDEPVSNEAQAENITAALQGDMVAQYNLGRWYCTGNGVTQNYAKAVEWFTKAAYMGHAAAQDFLGYHYQNGLGITQNYAKAVEWYTKAAEQGDADAQNNLGRCYTDGRSVTRDYAKAVEWFTKAAEQGYASAQLNLGICYEFGQGFAPNYAKAVEWYTKAAEQGHEDAQCSLGGCYYCGQGVTQDYVKAVGWYTKAAEQGQANAQFNLGVCYYYGQGVPQDYNRAGIWWSKAAAQGDKDAIGSLNKLKKVSSGIYVKIG